LLCFRLASVVHFRGFPRLFAAVAGIVRPPVSRATELEKDFRAFLAPLSTAPVTCSAKTWKVRRSWPHMPAHTAVLARDLCCSFLTSNFPRLRLPVYLASLSHPPKRPSQPLLRRPARSQPRQHSLVLLCRKDESFFWVFWMPILRIFNYYNPSRHPFCASRWP